MLSALDPKGAIFSHRLYRENCTLSGPHEYTKKLKLVANRKLNRCILVDDNEDNFLANSGNCIIINPISLKQTEDMELIYLTKLLSKLNKRKDFCSILRKLTE